MKKGDNVHVVSGPYLGYNGNIIEIGTTYVLPDNYSSLGFTEHTYTVAIAIPTKEHAFIKRWEYFQHHEIAPGFAPMELSMMRTIPEELPAA